jgi:hypothetical protein
MRRFTAGPSVRFCLSLRKWHEHLLINNLALEGIEKPDKSFLFYKACRYDTNTICGASIIAKSRTARIITHAPLRAKEASPFVSNKYPVVVCMAYIFEIHV